jgi:nucleotide-binding universal stress UspA family protein
VVGKGTMHGDQSPHQAGDRAGSRPERPRSIDLVLGIAAERVRCVRVSRPDRALQGVAVIVAAEAATDPTRHAPSPLRTIVVATDFSPNAAMARAWGEQIARADRALLVLVHAFNGPSSAPELVRWPSEYDDHIRSHVQSQLARQAEIARSNGAEVEAELGFGAAPDVVAASAERRGADLIVTGTRSRTAWKRRLLGSTAARLIRAAHCPVLTVHTKPAPRRIRTALVGTDFSEAAALAAETAARLFDTPAADRRLVLLHAYQVPYEARYVPAPVLMDAISAAETTVNRMIEERAQNLRAAGIKVDTVTCEGAPSEAIVRYADSLGADVIALGTHGRSALDRFVLGSNAERVITSASCPVLTIGSGVA